MSSDLDRSTFHDQPDLPYDGEPLDGRFKVVERAASGAWGDVYRGEHLRVGRPVAIKVLRKELIGSPEKKRRFEMEARAVSKLDHAGLVSVLDSGVTPNGSPYMAMEWLDGDTLDAIIAREGALPVPQVIDIFIQACEALHAAHTGGVIHRDIKPSNLMLTRDKETQRVRVKLLDFGLALMDQSPEEQRLTGAGLTVGTPAYMSPEQCTAQPLNRQSDIYGLGCCLFEALTGKRIFEAADEYGYMMKHAHDDPPSLRKLCPDMPYVRALDLTLQIALSKRPSDRYETAMEMADDLRAIINPKHKSKQQQVVRRRYPCQQRKQTRAAAIAAPPWLVPVILFLSLVFCVACYFIAMNQPLPGQ